MTAINNSEFIKEIISKWNYSDITLKFELERKNLLAITPVYILKAKSVENGNWLEL